VNIQGQSGNDRIECSDRRTRVDGGLRDVTNSSRLDHVSDSEALDGLVLADASRAVGAADEVNVATAVLVTATGASLLGLGDAMNSREEVQGRRGRVKHRVIRSRPTHPSLIKAIERKYCHEDDVYEVAQRNRDDPAVAHHFCSVERRARRRREDGGRGFFRSTRFGHPQRHISRSLASLQLLFPSTYSTVPLM
jgi:hypothetical protein